MKFEASIPLAPRSNNRIHTIARGKIIVCDDAKKWSQDFALLLKSKGLRPLPPPGGRSPTEAGTHSSQLTAHSPQWWVQVWIHVETKMDIDSVPELAINTIKQVLAVDDRFIGDLRVTKNMASTTTPIMHVYIYATEVPDQAAFNHQTTLHGRYESLDPPERRPPHPVARPSVAGNAARAKPRRATQSTRKGTAA